MNLGAGLSAANAFFNQNEHLQDRDYLAKQRAYQQAVMDSNQGGLADAAAASSATNRLKAEQARSDLSTLPLENQNRAASLGLESSDIAFKKEMQPTVQGNAKKSETVRGAGLDLATGQIPFNQKRQTASNAQEMNQQHMDHLATVGSLIGSGDEVGALNYMNAVANGDRTFVKFKPVKVNGHEVLQAFDSNGGYELLPRAAMAHAMGMKKTGKYTFMSDKETGRVVAGDERTGNAREVIAADPERMKALISGGSDSDPADVKTAKWLKRTGIAQTDQQSWDMARSALAKSRTEWVGDLMKTAIPSNSTPQEVTEIRKMLEEQYNALQQSSAPGLQSGSNTQNPVKINPTKFDAKLDGLTKP